MSVNEVRSTGCATLAGKLAGKSSGDAGSLASGEKRQTCLVCLRPQKTCICQWITPIAHEVQVLILQHPSEVSQAKGSARLLHLSLAHCKLVVSETFDQSALLSKDKQDVLLYPAQPDGAGGSAAMPEPPALEPALLRDTSRLRLIVLDGTWRKSRKMLYLNSWLQQLPRLALQDPPASRYRIRKAQSPGQLSTLEATCAALAQLEGNRSRYTPLLLAFDGFVAQQQAQPVLRKPAAIPFIEM